MNQLDLTSTRRIGLWPKLAIAAATSASVVAIAWPATSNADPEPPPLPATAAAPSTTPIPATPVPAPPLQPGVTNAQESQPVVTNGAPPPADPHAAPQVADANAPEPARTANGVGGFSYALPGGWAESDTSHLDYGSALLSKVTGPPPMPEQPPPVANDTRIVLGRLDQKLYASAEATNATAAIRLGSDMGEFFMPYPGTRVNQETVPLDANGLTGSASYYEVKFSDPSKLNGQIWTGVVGAPAASTPNVEPPQRWFVVWLGTSNNPVDKDAAKALAESIRPWASPPAPEAVPNEPAPAREVAPAPAPVPSQIQPA